MAKDILTFQKEGLALNKAYIDLDSKWGPYPSIDAALNYSILNLDAIAPFFQKKGRHFGVITENGVREYVLVEDYDKNRAGLTPYAPVSSLSDKDAEFEEVEEVEGSEEEVTPALLSKGYKTLVKGIPLGEQLTKENTVYEVRDHFNISEGSATNISEDISYTYDDSNGIFISNEITIGEQQAVIKEGDGSSYVGKNSNNEYVVIESSNVLPYTKARNFYLRKTVSRTGVYTIKKKLLVDVSITPNPSDNVVVNGVTYKGIPITLMKGTTLQFDYNDADSGLVIIKGGVVYDKDSDIIYKNDDNVIAYTAPADNEQVFVGVENLSSEDPAYVSKIEFVCIREKETKGDFTNVENVEVTIDSTEYPCSDAPISINLDSSSNDYSLKELFLASLTPDGVNYIIDADSYVKIHVEDAYLLANSNKDNIYTLDEDNEYTVSSTANFYILLKTPSATNIRKLKYITLPDNCNLLFKGGSIENGLITLLNTSIDSEARFDCILYGNIKNKYIRSSWFSDVHQAADNARKLGCGLHIDKDIVLSSPLDLFDIPFLLVEGNITNTATNVVEIGCNAQQTPVNKIEILGKVNYINMLGGKDLNITITSCTSFKMIADSSIAKKASIAYCRINLGDLYDFAIEGVKKGWINENTFIKGRIRRSLRIVGASYYHNNNIFYGTAIEGSSVTTTSLYFKNCSYNTFHDIRFETSATYKLSVEFDTGTSNNKIYRNWLHNNYSFHRRYINSSTVTSFVNRGTSSNGIFYGEDCIVKQWTIDKNDYIGHRDLAEVSLQENGTIRYEKAGVHLKLEVYPKSDFGIYALCAGTSGMFYTYATFYDQNDTIINDFGIADGNANDWIDVYPVKNHGDERFTYYVRSNGSFKVTETSGNVSFGLHSLDDFIAFEVRVNAINRRLAAIDAEEEVIRTLKKVVITMSSNNVRKTFKSIDVRLLQNPNYRQNNECVLTLPYKKEKNTISNNDISITPQISNDSNFGTNNIVPNYYLLKGESCDFLKRGIEYKRQDNVLEEHIYGIVNRWVINKDTYVNNRNVEKVHLNNTDVIKLWTVSGHTRLHIFNDDYVVVYANATTYNSSKILSPYITLYDQNDDKITTNLAAYMRYNGIQLALNTTNYWYATGQPQYILDTVKIYINIKGMNTALVNTATSVKHVIVTFACYTANTTFKDISIAISQNNGGVSKNYIELPFKTEGIAYNSNIQISNESNKGYLLDGESYHTTNNSVHKRVGTSFDVVPGFKAGEFLNRPSDLTTQDIGFRYFDTNYGKPLYVKSIENNKIIWADANGTRVYDVSVTDALILESVTTGTDYTIKVAAKEGSLPSDLGVAMNQQSLSSGYTYDSSTGVIVVNNVNGDIDIALW